MKKITTALLLLAAVSLSACGSPSKEEVAKQIESDIAKSVQAAPKPPKCPGMPGVASMSYDDLAKIKELGECSMVDATLMSTVKTCADGSLYLAYEVAQVNGRTQAYDGSPDPWAYVKVAKGQTAPVKTADDAGDVSLSTIEARLGC